MKAIYWGPSLTLVLLVLILLVAILSPVFLGSLVVNSLVGIVLLLLLNLFPSINIPINVWTVLIVALGGLLGVLILLLLNFSKVEWWEMKSCQYEVQVQSVKDNTHISSVVR